MTNTESLMVLWLKHIEKCQVTQTNWNAAISSWELRNEDDIKKLMAIMSKFFLKNFQLNLYESPITPLLFLQQGNIEVLGLKINSSATNIYGVSITHDKSSFDSGNFLGPLEEIIKKMIRTALLTIGYFNISNANIIFAEPKINKNLYESLLNVISGLNNIFESMGYDFTFELIVNGNYKEIVFEPVIKLTKAANDSSELFSKNVQMSQTSSIRSDNNTTTKIGKFIRIEFEKLMDNGLLTEEIVHNLCDNNYSKEILDLRFPMLKRYNDKQSLVEQRLVKGNGRYYSHVYYINGQKYLLTNDWYEKNRGKLLMWINKIKTRK
ncbi:hypothetical protein [Bacillus salipaludis]|uniref:Uncharacterized protein n=1 Tax=Bacillus salipaludis TaxID=2547811 RepID=A0AA90TVX2_9BACI|nr:hypothetical protein [Bacillus salipaludis]MDQ6598093.1 hypothetical protein [Bacillus salipaludis]